MRHIDIYNLADSFKTISKVLKCVISINTIAMLSTISSAQAVDCSPIIKKELSNNALKNLSLKSDSLDSSQLLEIANRYKQLLKQSDSFKNQQRKEFKLKILDLFASKKTASEIASQLYPWIKGPELTTWINMIESHRKQTVGFSSDQLSKYLSGELVAPYFMIPYEPHEFEMTLQNQPEIKKSFELLNRVLPIGRDLQNKVLDLVQSGALEFDEISYGTKGDVTNVLQFKNKGQLVAYFLNSGNSKKINLLQTSDCKISKTFFIDAKKKGLFENSVSSFSPQVCPQKKKLNALYAEVDFNDPFDLKFKCSEQGGKNTLTSCVCPNKPTVAIDSNQQTCLSIRSPQKTTIREKIKAILIASGADVSNEFDLRKEDLKLIQSMCDQTADLNSASDQNQSTDATTVK